MKSMLGTFIATAAMVVAMLLSSQAEAQSRIVVTRNGKPYIVVTQTPRCVTPRIVPRVRHVRPPFRYTRHVQRFYNARNHARHRCTYCIAYERWLKWRPRRYDPIRHVCR